MNPTNKEYLEKGFARYGVRAVGTTNVVYQLFDRSTPRPYKVLFSSSSKEETRKEWAILQRRDWYKRGMLDTTREGWKEKLQQEIT